MTKALLGKINEWNLKHPCNTWDTWPTGLSVYAAFSGCYGFRVFMGFGWERVHTLATATQLQNHRKHGGNWKALWCNRKYAM